MVEPPFLRYYYPRKSTHGTDSTALKGGWERPALGELNPGDFLPTNSYAQASPHILKDFAANRGREDLNVRPLTVPNRAAPRRKLNLNQNLRPSHRKFALHLH